LAEASNVQLVLAVIWFFIGFGVGFFILRLWVYILVALILAILVPIILPMLGLPQLFTTSEAIATIEKAITLFASFIANNAYSLAGFALGIILGLALAFIRR